MLQMTEVNGCLEVMIKRKFRSFFNLCMEEKLPLLTDAKNARLNHHWSEEYNARILHHPIDE